jgi:hypothetical protein
MYPDVVEMTPSILSKGGSMHQKHPPAKVAVATDGAFGCPARIGIAARTRMTAAM